MKEMEEAEIRMEKKGKKGDDGEHDGDDGSSGNHPPIIGIGKIISGSGGPSDGSSSERTSSKCNNGNSDTCTGISDGTSTSTVINGVPVVVAAPSTIIIGDQTITAIPSTPTTVIANGQLFTVNSEQIIAPSTTLQLLPSSSSSSGTGLTPVTAGGITFSIDSTIALVSGKTYTIGPGATATITTVINSETVRIGIDGFSFPTTTVTVSPVASAGDADTLETRAMAGAETFVAVLLGLVG